VGKLKPVKKATEAFLKRAAEIQADERLMDVARQHHYQHVTAPVGENAQPYQYGRHLEPAGMYTTPLPKLPDEVPEWAEVVFGKSDYKNPLVIPFGPENYDSRTNWKRELSRLYDGKSGKDLTDAIRADGYDAVVTVVAPKRSPKADKFPQYYPEEGRLGEVVDLYKGKGGVVMPSLAAGVGLGLAGQSEDADAAPIVKAGRRMIEAYHGSPHKFDKFSMENIGTGEGAQAYGHGLYFADSEDVARNYRNDLTQRGLLGGKDVIQPDGVSDAEAAIVQGALSKFEGFWESPKDIVREMRRNAAELEDTADYYNTQRQWMDDPLKQHMVTDAHRQNLIDLEEQMGQQRSDMEALQIIERSGGIDAFKPQGALYRVHLDVDPDTLLDWDKPLSEQPESVQKLYREAVSDPQGDADLLSQLGVPDNYASGAEIPGSDVSGSQIYAAIAEKMRSANSTSVQEINSRLSELSRIMDSDSAGGYRQFRSDVGRNAAEEYDRLLEMKTSPESLAKSYKPQVSASEQMRQAGIPGIRYLDGNSRGAGEGSYNYVMFDDKPISIQERGNVDPTLLAATGGTSAIGLAASQFLQNRQQKQSQWESLRNDLLNTVTSVDRAIGKGFEALEMPWRGLLGLNRTVAGLLYGEGAQAVQEGARVAQQPVEQTAYDMGGVATDASGSPVVGAAVNTMVNLGGPI
jgi:hypothetical protein